MKHWINFLEKRSNEAQRLGKMVNALDFELLEARQNLEMYEAQKNAVEAKIYDIIEPLYTNSEECKEAVQQAKEMAQKYNSEPKTNHIPIPTKKKRSTSNESSINEVQS
jgi:hypothetical protein